MHTRVDEELGLDGNDRLIPLTDARAVVGISRSKIYQLISEGSFPRPIKVGARSLFSENELQAWITALIRERARRRV